MNFCSGKKGVTRPEDARNLAGKLRRVAAWTTVAFSFLLCPAGRGQSARGYRNVAFWREPGVRIVVSSHQFRRAKTGGYQGVCPLNHGLPAPGEPAACDWVSNPFQHLPQWVWIHFAGPRRIDKVVLYAGNIASSPVEFSGQYLAAGGTAFRTFFHVQQARFDLHTLTYTVRFKPVVTDNFRLLIERTAVPATPQTMPQSWIAELAQLEVYGVDAPAAPETSPSAEVPPAADAALDSGLNTTQFDPTVRDMGQSVDIRTAWYRLVLDKSQPRILFLSWDSLGQGDLNVNFLLKDGAHPVLDPLFQAPMPLGPVTLIRTGNVFHYSPVEVAPGAYEQVSIRAGQRGFDLALAARAHPTVTMRGGLFRFDFAANQTPTTFVCHPSKILNYVSAPTYLAAPDFGTAYVTATGDPGAFYRKPSALFPASTYWVDVTPHEPSGEDGLNRIGPKPWRIDLHFGIQRTEPLPALVDKDSRLKRLPDYSLNMVQWRPDTGVLSNSVMSIDCGLAILFYAQEAVFAPHLEDGISPMELVRASVERYFEGAPGYQMPNRSVLSPDWWSSRETAAYLVISAWYVVRTIGGAGQLRPWLAPLESLANHLESQFGPDGLIYHEGRGSMWFDTYKIEGADAYSNAADYRAFRCMADMETLAGRTAQAERYRHDADRIQAAYFKSFYNDKTGVLAGWRTRDGALHDYMFPWVNGFAITQGLVPDAAAKEILQRLLAKLQSIDFHSYQLGLPTNLIPMSPADYIPHTSGAPKQADGMDTWQIYMNGGATPALEYYVIQALYQTGQYEAAERLLWPLMQSYENGTFNAGIQLPGLPQRNPVGSAFYRWNGSHGAGEGYLPEDWDGVEALFTGHYGIGFNSRGYYLEPWSPLKGKTVKLDLPYMGKLVPYVGAELR
jgi:Bacterial alpha-L-rhamnosidase 6 hairpin glycosidase domain